MEALEQEIKAMFGVFGAIIIIIAIFVAIILWLIIKSAVRTGVEEALEKTLGNTTVSTSIDNVTNGVVMDTRDVTPQQQYYYDGQQYNENWE